MALDHYVPQVYLRQWVDDATGLLHAMRKSDLKRFTPRPKDVCRIEAGNTNPYLQPARAIETFLAQIEPKYTWAVETFVRGELHRDAVFVIAGLMASTMVCSPGGLRINAEPAKRILEEVGRRLDRSGKIPKPPPDLGATSFSELLDKGLIKVAVDSKHPQAIGITVLLEQVNAYGNFCWELLVHDLDDSPFFTSDYPVAIETDTAPIVNRVFPLTPYVAVRVIPDVKVDTSKTDFAFKHFRYRVRKVTRSQVRYLNRLFVRCAEDVVFYCRDEPWVAGFIEQNAQFRIQPVSQKVPHGNGALIANTCIVSDAWE